MIPQHVVIVGGSIAGLLQGIQLKRKGSTVIVIEQDPSKQRHSHESGVSIGPSVVALLEKYDATKRPAAVPTAYISAAWHRRLRVVNKLWAHSMSNWGCLYLILRANFDGLVSEVVPSSPAPLASDGHTEYWPGKRVVGLDYDREQGTVDVHYVDVLTGEKDSVCTGLVLGADGVHSTVRKLVGAETRQEYAGYIGWRGVVPERLLSKETVDYFSNRLNFTLLTGTYFISYLIPTEAGETEPSKRLLNWVWYYQVGDGSSEMDTIFTDVEGKVHGSTVPQGLVQPDVWAAQIDRYQDKMIAPLLEAVRKTPRPFVTKVSEAQCLQASFCDGHIVLVGDAFTTLRSHLGMASEQAARHCLQMNRVWQGEISQDERDREAVFYAKRFVLLNRMVGLCGMGWVWSLFKTVCSFVWLVTVGRE